MIKIINIICLKCLITFSAYGQIADISFFVNNTFVDTKKEDIKTLQGKFFVFPTGEIIHDLDLIISFHDSLYFNAEYELDGEFSLETNFTGNTNLSINFSDANFRKKAPYYPIEIKNVRFDVNSVDLGIIPIIVDTFGYHEEFLTYRKFLLSSSRLKFLNSCKSQKI